MIIHKAEMNMIKTCFETILHGNKEESRLAARMVRKILYRATVSSDRSKYNEISETINNAVRAYSKIQEEWRQENFVTAISVIYFLHDREDQPDFLFPWLLHLLQHQNGYIRHAAVKMISLELGPLTFHIRFPNEESYRLRPEKADRILYPLFINLNKLMATMSKQNGKYKYNEFLPPSAYKSVQMILADLEDFAGREYLDYLVEQYNKQVDKIGVA